MNTSVESEQNIVEYPHLRAAPPAGLGAILVGKEEEELLLEVVRSKGIFRYAYDLPPERQGQMSATLEKEFCEMIGVRYALALTSGTAALEVALAALNIGPGDEVILAAYTWRSCFTSIVRSGALPVLAEVDETLCLAPGEITRLKTSRTKAVMVVHYQGVSAEMDALLAEAKEADISVIEDCAEATGALYHGRRVGSMGHVGIYSFQFQKMMTSGEGGMLVTNDAKTYERAVQFHDLGQMRPYHAQFVSPSEPEFCGGQYRMNEVTAAVAVAQRRRVDHTRAHCRELHQRIMRKIENLSGLTFRQIPDPEGESCIEIYFFLETEGLAQKFSGILSSRNIHCMKRTGTVPHYNKPYCVNRATVTEAGSPFRQFSTWPAKGYRAEDFPRTERIVHRFVAIPIGALYTTEDADYIAATIVAAHEEVCGTSCAGEKR